MLSFALNHMTVPGLRYDAVLELASALGCVGVEFRNDLNRPLFDGDDPASVGLRARNAGQRILALAEIKDFNDWTEARRDEAETLIATAKAAGAEAVSLIPRNDGGGRGNGERQANLRLSLRELGPMLEEAGLLGFVEPLGFESCSLRRKEEAVDAIEALGLTRQFRLIHDTFHHHLAGGGASFPAMTGIVHVSGVVDPVLATGEMRDEHRIFVDEHDRLGNVAQIEALLDAGYAGPVSVEAFAPDVHALSDPGRALARSFECIRSRLKVEAT